MAKDKAAQLQDAQARATAERQDMRDDHEALLVAKQRQEVYLKLMDARMASSAKNLGLLVPAPLGRTSAGAGAGADGDADADGEPDYSEFEEAQPYRKEESSKP